MTPEELAEELRKLATRASGSEHETTREASQSLLVLANTVRLDMPRMVTLLQLGGLMAFHETTMKQSLQELDEALKRAAPAPRYHDWD